MMRVNRRRLLNPAGYVITVVIATATLFAALLLVVGFAESEAVADPHSPCTGGIVGIEPDAAQNIATYDASPDIVTGVCIKSGTMFAGDHSQLFTEDTANIENCYTITGIGTSSVTVQRTGTAGPGCQGISHIDVLVGAPTPTPTPAPSPSPTPSPTEQPPGQTPTATATPAPGVLGETRGPTALPATGQAGQGRLSDGLTLPALGALLTLGGLLSLGGARALAVARKRRR